MAKKMIEPEKSWFVKEPAKIEEILEAAGLFVNNELLVKAIYCDINRVFTLHNYADSFVRKSVIVNHFSKKRRCRVKLLETVLDNKWLFYTQDIEMGTDTLIQPVFDMAKMTERKINKLINAITNNDYARLQKLAPNEVYRFDKYSNCLFKEEPGGSLDLNLHVTNVPSTPARDGSELIAENEQENADMHGQSTDHGLTMRGQCTDHGLTMHDLARIEDTRVAKESREKREGDKENKRFNLGCLDGSGPLDGAGKDCQPTNQDKTTDKKPDECYLTAESTWEEYLKNLTAESKELQSLMDFSGDDREFLMANLDKFKQVLSNMMVLRGKTEKEELKNNYFKNEYLFTLLRKPNERAKIVDSVKNRLTFKIQNDFRHQKKGYKWDLFNKDGDRMSGGRVIPRDAPPQPSPDHCWDFDSGKWCI